MRDYIKTLRRRLVELGCPLAHVRRLVREMADHRDDLKQAALVEGLSEPDAEVRANAQLGDPLVLAEQMMVSLRRSSWWGRHFVVTFGLLPILAYPVLWALFLVLELLLVVTLGYGWDSKRLDVVTNNPVTFHHLLKVCHFMDYLAVALATLLFCWLARRAAVKLKWMVTACAICSVAAIITWVKIEPHSFSLGFSMNSQLDLPWSRGLIPLLVAGAIYVFQRWTMRRFQEKAAA
ncbi:MAG: hypothetical protein ACREDQ_09655 [Limisphaerales bacterium]